MPELSGRELLQEWERLMRAVVAAAGSVAGHSELPRQLAEPMQRQLELVREVIERERRLQAELTARVIAPVDGIFELLEETGAMLRLQANALRTAGRALDETAGLVNGQAELLERTLATLRRPTDLAKAAAGVDAKPRKRGARRPRR